VIFAVSLAASSALFGQQAPANKPFFLPKNPVAAAYVLGRLSNKELIEAPRGEFVYTALLGRQGLERKYRLEALAGLAALRHTDALSELVRAMDDLDKSGDDSAPVLRDLGAILLQTEPPALEAKRDGLGKISIEAQMPLVRQIAYAALITVDHLKPAAFWESLRRDPARLADALLAVPMVREADARSGAYETVDLVLRHAPSPEVLRTAITAFPSIPGHDAEAFNRLAEFIRSGTERAAAVAALQKIPRGAWAKNQAGPLVESLIAALQNTPVDQRAEPDAIGAAQLASELAALLPPEQSKTAAKTLRGLGVSVFVIHTIREQMLYDKTLIVVEAGKPVEIILINDDAMPHNLAVVAPGALEEIGQLAEKMPLEPDAEGRLYIPDSPKVLHATKLADPGQEVRLSFTAPEEPGDYQYVCTFPGHWRRMTGTLAVVSDVEAYLATHAESAQPKMTDWKIDDFKLDLTAAGSARDLADGRELFTKLGCAQCHKLGATGPNYGPDLTDVFHRYNNDRATVLRQVLEPSLVISNRYVNYEFVLKEGDSLFGMIVKEDPASLTVQTGPSDALIQQVKKSDLKERRPQSSSIMPAGLLSFISKAQILDLLAYLEAGGKIK
jgi:putative heme-binding domain-containing protein